MKSRFLVSLLVISFAISCLAAAQGVTEPKHLTDARALVKKLDLDKTGYEHGAGRVKFTAPVESHTDCSGLINHLLEHSYAYDDGNLQKWFGAKRPTAARYHDAIVKKSGFTHILEVKDAQPGDFLAVKYYLRKDNTGHIMIVSGVPAKMASKEPIVEGTEQWQVKVIDSSKSGHGTTDTRYKKGKDGKDHDGLGEGIFRIYVGQDGNIAGFAWSTLAVSKFKDPAEEHLVIGRLKAGFKP